MCRPINKKSYAGEGCVCVCWGGGGGGGGQGGGGQNLEKVGLAVGNIEEGLHKTGVRSPLPTMEIEMSEQF